MKKIFLIFTLTVFLYSCDTQVSSEPAEIGFTILQDGQRSTITAGPASASEVVEPSFVCWWTGMSRL